MKRLDRGSRQSRNLKVIFGVFFNGPSERWWGHRKWRRGDRHLESVNRGFGTNSMWHMTKRVEVSRVLAGFWLGQLTEQKRRCRWGKQRKWQSLCWDTLNLRAHHYSPMFLSWTSLIPVKAGMRVSLTADAIYKPDTILGPWHCDRWRLCYSCS